MANFESIRNWLNQEGYNESMPPEATSLVNHLVTDLKHLKVAKDKMQQELHDKKEECQKLKISLEPYQLENGNLHKLNNQHHMDKIILKEQLEKSEKEKKNAVEKLENDCKDFRFLVEELKAKISKLEKESSLKSAKIVRLQERNLKAVIITPEGSHNPISSQRQRLEMSSELPKPSCNNKCAHCGCWSRKRGQDVYMTDLLKLTDQKMMELNQELNKYKNLLKEHHQTCDQLQQKIVHRDTEIARLHGAIEGGRTVSAILEDNELRVTRSRMMELQMENDLLKKSKNHLDATLNVVHGKTHEAMNRALALANENHGLTSELHDATSTNRLLEQDVASTAEVLLAKLTRVKERLTACESDLAEQHRLFHLMRDERDRLKDELNRINQNQSILLQEREPLIEDNRQMEGVLKKGQEEKKKMADKLNHLTVHLQEADMEKHRLESEVAALRSTICKLEKNLKETQSSSDHFRKKTEQYHKLNEDLNLQNDIYDSEIKKLKQMVAQLEQEREYYKDQSHELQGLKESAEQARDYYSADVERQNLKIQKLEKNNQLLSDNLSKIEMERNEYEQEKDHYSEQVKQLLDILKTRPTQSRSQVSRDPRKPEEELCRLEYEIDILKQERNFYKTQFQAVKNRSQDGPLPQNGFKPVSPVLSIRKKSEEDKDVDVEQLKTEREFFRKQMDHFQQLYNDAKSKLLRGHVSPVSEVSVSPPSDASSGRGMEVKALRQELRHQQEEMDFFKSQYERLKNSINKSPVDIEEDPQTLLHERDMYLAERDFYMAQYKDLSDKTAQYALTPHGVKSKKAKQEIDAIMTEKRHITLSKAELEAEVRNLRQEVAELEQDNHTLDSQAKVLNKTVESLQDTASQKFPPSMQAFIGEIRKSRDAALSELAEIKKDRDSIRQKLKVLNVQLHKDNATAQEDIQSLRHKIDDNEDFSTDLQQRLQSQALLISSLQDQTNALKSALKQTQNELSKSNKQSVQLRKVLEMKTGEMGSQGEQLGQSVTQLQDAKLKLTKLENELEEAMQSILKLETENKGLKGNLGQLDHDKDLLNSDLTSKSEVIAALRNELRLKTINIAELEGSISKLERQLESCEMQNEIEKRRGNDEAERNQRFQQDLAVATEQKEIANKEIRRLQNDIIGYQQDIHELQQELEKVKASREAFKLKAQEYCRTLEDLSHAISSKDAEQNQLMKQYLDLNETLSSLKTINASLEEDAATKTKEMIQMDDLIKSCKDERQQLHDEINRVSKRSDELEAKSQTLEQEKFAVEKDLLAVKDLNQKTDVRREENENEVHRLSLMLQKVFDDKKTLEIQLASISEQLASERSAVHSLDELLNEKRRSEFICESTNKQLEVEKNQLQRKVTELRSQLDDEVSETRRLRSRIGQTELEIERIRRELTNEKYERERASQELRRVQKYTQMTSALLSVDADAKGTTTPPISKFQSFELPKYIPDPRNSPVILPHTSRLQDSDSQQQSTSSDAKEPWKIAFHNKPIHKHASSSSSDRTSLTEFQGDYLAASLACFPRKKKSNIPITVPQGDDSDSQHS